MPMTALTCYSRHLSLVSIRCMPCHVMYTVECALASQEMPWAEGDEKRSPRPPLFMSRCNQRSSGPKSPPSTEAGPGFCRVGTA